MEVPILKKRFDTNKRICLNVFTLMTYIYTLT